MPDALPDELVYREMPGMGRLWLTEIEMHCRLLVTAIGLLGAVFVLGMAVGQLVTVRSGAAGVVVGRSR